MSKRTNKIGVCPHCGYCEHCGRGGHGRYYTPIPYYPQYPWYQYGGSGVTISSSSGGSNSIHGHGSNTALTAKQSVKCNH